MKLVCTPRANGYALAIAAILVLAACGDDSQAAPNPFEGHQSELYEGTANWLCHAALADVDNLCLQDLDATVVNPDATTSLEPHVPAVDPPIDCFYVYPTVSVDEGDNADLVRNDEELFIIREQAARLSRVCRVFAPLYRQLTIGGIFNAGADARTLAYGDVVDAFSQYMGHHNDGRGVVLVGHSQGTGHLSRLLQDTIEVDDYLSDKLVAVYLLGGTIQVPEGQTVGGTFASTPLCTATDQSGCVVTYSTYKAGNPPTAGALFGGNGGAGMVAACVNPADLAGGPAILDSYFPTEIVGFFSGLIGEVSPYADPMAHDPIATPSYKMPNFLSGQCVSRNDYTFLEITPQADPMDPRVDDVRGEFIQGWGLHLVDVTVAMGDILALIENQTAAWQADR